MNISAVMIVKDGEETIAKTLDSLKAFDDVVVYDTGSTDNTINIVKAYDNVVLHLSHFTGFSHSKNQAAKLAKNDWILSIDADEVVSPELLNTLQTIELQDNTVYKIKRNNYYRNCVIKYSGWGNEYVIRLYNKEQTQFNGKLVHEHIDYDDMQLEKIAGDLRHYSYLSISHFVIKRDLYSSLFAEENKGKRKSSPIIALLKGAFDFLNTYLVKLGFLDGYRGLLIAVSNANVTFYKYLKLYEANVSHYSKICLVICCNKECTSVKKTVKSALNQSLPPDNIIICTKHNDTVIAKEVEYLKRNSFIPISLEQAKSNETFANCITRMIETIKHGFIIITYGNNVWLTEKFVTQHVKNTKPCNYTLLNGIKISETTYKWYSNKRRKNTFVKVASFLKSLLVDVYKFFKNNIHYKESSFSIAFYKDSYTKCCECDNDCNNLKQQIISILNSGSIEQKKINYPILEYKQQASKPQILVCLDRLKFLHCGLGQVALNFGRELLKQQSNDYDIVFMLPKKGFKEFERKANYIKLNTFKSIFRGYMKNYDLCHVPHQLPSYSFGSSKKNILTIHDLNFILTKSVYKSNRYLKRVQQNIHRSDAIVFISDFTKEMTYRYLDIPENKRVAVIHNGVIIPTESDISPTWLPNKKFLFSIGQFLEKKNFHVLLPFIKKFSDDYILVIAGENKTSYGERLKNELKELKIENKVIFPGGISEEEKGYLYHNCTAFLFPSIAEGFGLPVIEAMLCSKPIFCSDRTSMREIGNEFAFFWTDFDSENMIKVYEKGMALIEKGNHLQRQKEYAQGYTYAKNVEKYLQIYQELLSENVNS